MVIFFLIISTNTYYLVRICLNETFGWRSSWPSPYNINYSYDQKVNDDIIRMIKVYILLPIIVIDFKKLKLVLCYRLETYAFIILDIMSIWKSTKKLIVLFEKKIPIAQWDCILYNIMDQWSIVYFLSISYRVNIINLIVHLVVACSVM